MAAAIILPSPQPACRPPALPCPPHPTAQAPCYAFTSTLSNSTTRLVVPQEDIVYTYIAAAQHAVNKTVAEASCDALRPHAAVTWDSRTVTWNGAYGGGYAENRAVGVACCYPVCMQQCVSVALDCRPSQRFVSDAWKGRTKEVGSRCLLTGAADAC